MLQEPCHNDSNNWCDVPNGDRHHIFGNGSYPRYLCKAWGPYSARFVVRVDGQLERNFCVAQHPCEQNPKAWCGGSELSDRRSMDACVIGRAFVEENSRCIEHASYERFDGTYGEIVTRLNSMGPCRAVARLRSATPVAPSNASSAE